MIILGIDTATEFCSVSLFDENNIIAELSTNEKNAHSSVLTVLIEKILSQTGTSIQSLSAVAVSEGPGSYTGLRIGFSAAKGICYASDLPLIAIPTLDMMAHGIKKKMNHTFDGYIIPMIDARRMEIYTAIFDSKLHKKLTDTPLIIDENNFADYKGKSLLIGGSGALKFYDFHQNSFDIRLSLDYNSMSADMQNIAVKKYNQKEYSDLIYSEPNYLKAFYSGR